MPLLVVGTISFLAISLILFIRAGTIPYARFTSTLPISASYCKTNRKILHCADLAHCVPPQFMVYSPTSSWKDAGVAQWQSSSLPSWLRGFDSLRPLQPYCQSGVMAAAADSKSAVREYVRVRVPPLAPAKAKRFRRDVRVVDGATLERLCGRKSTGGSNPPLSASLWQR